ncbi:HicB family protein [archaeon SCG-AAA382B04]|nr:HicB family protein [archaeon SCG-AAA382B04]
MCAQKLKITLILNDDGWWTAKNNKVQVASQGKTRKEALDNLDKAIALKKGKTGHKPTEEELKEVGIEPKNNSAKDKELPDILK